MADVLLVLRVQAKVLEHELARQKDTASDILSGEYLHGQWTEEALEMACAISVHVLV